MVGTVVAVGGALAVLGYLAFREEDEERTIWLIQGKRYAIAHRVQGPGWDVSMYPGFCNFTDPAITAEGTGPVAWAEVQFSAEWCAPNQEFEVPTDMAITEVPS